MITLDRDDIIDPPHKVGSARGTCSGEAQPYRVGVSTAPGPSFTIGDVDAEATIDTADPGTRTINETTTTNETPTYAIS